MENFKQGSLSARGALLASKLCYSDKSVGGGEERRAITAILHPFLISRNNITLVLHHLIRTSLPSQSLPTPNGWFILRLHFSSVGTGLQGVCTFSSGLMQEDSGFVGLDSCTI